MNEEHERYVRDGDAEPDSLAPARGCIYGMAISIAFFAALVGIIVVVRALT